MGGRSKREIKKRIIRQVLLSLSALIALASFSVANGVEEITLEVKGEAPIYDNEIVEAKKMALEDAFRTAVMKAMGAWVTAESFTRNFVPIENSVLTRSRGYIKTYEVVDITVGENVVCLTVKVTVNVSPLQADLNTLLGAVGNPRFVHLAENPLVQEMIERALKEKGFTVIPCMYDWPEEITPTIFTEIYEECFAEILLLTKVDAQYSTIVTQGSKIWGCIIPLTTDVFWLDTGERIMSAVAHANGAGVTKEVAFKQAVERACPDLLDRLVEGISQAWTDLLLNGRSIVVIAAGLSYEDLMKLKEHINGLFGVKNVILRDFEDSTATLEVWFAGSSQTFADLIAMTDFKDLTVKIVAVKASEIRLAITSRP